MATVNLGRIKPIFKGAYAGGTAYVVDDIVTSGNETFICILASTGNATSNATYWTKLAAKGTDGSNGTNGTDLSTTLTTQGDILYRDGSGLQRLAKGTAGQVVQMNSGATAPEYADASGGAYELLTKITVASDASSVALSSTYLTSAYTKYMIIGHLIMTGVANNSADVRAIPSKDNGANYNLPAFSAAMARYYNLANNAEGSYDGNMNENGGRWKIGGAIKNGSGNDRHGSLQFVGHLFNAEQTSDQNYSSFIWDAGRYYSTSSNEDYLMRFSGQGLCEVGSGTVNNIKFEFTNQSIADGSTISLFGIKES